MSAHRPLPPLVLGAGLVRRILPIRAPMLMVDRVEGYARAPAPEILAARHLSLNEPVFEAHFTFMPVLPGTLILEGLSQASGLLAALVMLQRAWERDGRDPDAVLESLRNLDRGYRLEPGYRPGQGDELLATAFDPARPVRWGMLAASDVKYRKPVFPGERLDYHVRLAREFEALWHFEVEASVRGHRVADGTLVNGFLDTRLPGAPR